MNIQALSKKLVRLVTAQITLTVLNKELDKHYGEAHKIQDEEALDKVQEAYDKLADGFEKIVNTEVEVMEDIIDSTELDFILN